MGLRAAYKYATGPLSTDSEGVCATGNKVLLVSSATKMTPVKGYRWAYFSNDNRPTCAYKVIIPAKAFARDYVITGVRLSVCLFVCLLPR